MARLFTGFAELGFRGCVPCVSGGLNAKQRLRHARVSVCRSVCHWLPLLALVLVVATGSGAFAQTQQMNTVTTIGVPLYSVTAGGICNVFLPAGGRVYGTMCRTRH